MSNLNELLKLEQESEHVLEHDLPTKRLFFNPKIHTAIVMFFRTDSAIIRSLPSPNF